MPIRYYPIANWRGLYTHFDQITGAPVGSLSVAENCLIEREYNIEKRRGFQRYASTSSAGSVSQFLDFKNRLLVLDGTTLKYDSDGAGTLANYSGTYSAPTGRKMRFVEPRTSLLFTTSDGVFKNDSLTGTPTLAGIPRPLDFSLATAGASGFLANTESVGYRLRFVRIDANSFELAGPPSFVRQQITNSAGGSRDVTIQFTIPEDIVAGDYYEVYRTQTNATADVGDEMFRVIRNQISASDITAGTISFTDTYDDAFLGERLETNPSVQGATQASERPPFAKDIAVFKGVTYYANTRQEHQLELRLLTVTGLTDGTSSISIITPSTTLTYTFETAEDIGNQEFKRETGLATSGQNVDATVESLIRVINRDTNNTEIDAYFTTDPNEGTRGQFLLRARTPSVDQFSVIVDATGTGSAFSPTLPTSGSTVASTNDQVANRLYFSKLEQPEAVPELNYEDIGTEESPIERILPLRDSLIILKEDGVYRLSGTGGPNNFDIKQQDPNIRIVGPDTAVVLGNKVVAMTNQGVVEIDESGSAIISRPVEKNLKEAAEFTDFTTIAFAAAHEQEDKYFLHIQEFESDTAATITYVYDNLMRVWTIERKAASADYVLFDTNTRFLAHSDSAYILSERKSRRLNNEDYLDEELPFTVVSTGTTTDEDGNTVSTITGTYTDYAVLGVGDRFVQGEQAGWIVGVTANSATSYTVTIDRELTVAAGAATIELGIDAFFTTTRIGFDNPAMQKYVPLITYIMEEDSAVKYTVGVATNLVTGFEQEEIDVSSHALGGWGSGAFGGFPFGDADLLTSTPVPKWVGNDYRLCRTFTARLGNNRARENFKCSCLNISYQLFGDYPGQANQ